MYGLYSFLCIEKTTKKTSKTPVHSRWKASPGLKSGAGEEFFRFSGPISDIKSGFCSIKKAQKAHIFCYINNWLYRHKLP
jgi:hypothetical protein